MTTVQSIRWQILILVSCLLPLLATSTAAAPLQPSSRPSVTPIAAAAPTRLTTPEIVLTGSGSLTTWQITSGFIYACTSAPNARLFRRPLVGQLVTELNIPCNQVDHFQADSSGVYYYDAPNDQIKAVYTDTPTATPVVLAAVGNDISAYLAVDGAYVYWIESIKQSGDDVDAIYAHRVRRILKQGGTPATVASYQGGRIALRSRVGLEGQNVWWIAQDGLYQVRKPTVLCPQQQCPVSHIAPLTVDNGQLTVARNGDILWWGEVLQPDNSAKRQLLRTRCSPCQSFVKHNAANGATIFAATQDDPAQNGYVVESNRLLRVDMTTGQAPPIADGISNFPAVVTLDGGYVYFTLNSTSVARLPLDTTAIDRDLRVNGMEITQAIQNLANDVPLVAGKTTFVRLYATVGSGDDGAAAVEAGLRGFRSGIELPGSPLKPIRRTAAVTGSFDRGEDDAGWVFRLPYDWVRPPFEDLPQSDVMITLQGTVDPRNISIDRDRANNHIWETITLTAKAPICLEMYRVLADGLTQPLTDSMVGLATNVAESLLPTPRVMAFNRDAILASLVQQCPLSQSPTGICMTPYILDSDATAILNRLQRLGNFTDDPVSCVNNNGFTHQAGIVHPDATWTFGGLARRPGISLLAQVPSPGLALIPRLRTKAVTLAEEMGHNYGRMHVNCGGPLTFDLNYPYDPTRLDDPPYDRPTTYFGFDPLTRQVLHPRDNQDFLGYCPLEWISDYTWRAIYATMNSPIVTRFTTDFQTSIVPDNVVIVSGVINSTAGQGDLDYAWSYSTADASPGLRQKWEDAIAKAQGLTSAYHLQVMGSSGQVLHDQPIDLGELSIAQASGQPFTAIFAKPAGAVQQLQLLHNDTVLATHDVGSNTPTIEILAPTGGASVTDEVTVVWRGDDVDAADKLRYTVQYSPDQGAHWYPLLFGLEGAKGIRQEIKLSIRNQAGTNGSTALLRLLASDGYHTGLTTSALFSVAPQAPTVAISAPTAGQWHWAAEPVLLRGRAFDAEEGFVADADLIWSGEAITGHGQHVEVMGLAPGSHTVNLQATDRTGAQSSTQTTFNIAPLNIQGVSDTELTLDGICDDSRYAQAEAVPLSAYADGAQATAHMIHTDDDLWVCLIGLKKGEGYAGVVIDVDNSDDESVKSGDLGYFVGQDGAPLALRGDDDNGFITDSLTSVTTRISEIGDAWTAELRIRGNKLEGWDRRVGLAVVHRTAQNSNIWVWPVTADLAVPQSWGQVNLGLAPAVGSVEPSTFTRGDSATVITVTGSGFTDLSQVVWQGAPLTTTFINGTTLQAMVGESLLNQGGNFNLEVVNTAAPNLKSLPYGMTVINPQPAIDAISPDSADAGDSALILTITGSNFIDGALLYWNDRNKPTTFVNNSQLQATVTTADLAAGGVIQVRVINPEPNNGMSNALSFTVTGAPSPPDVQIYLPVVIK